MKLKHLLPGLVLSFAVSSYAFAAETTIAVAANFTKTIEEIAKEFKKDTGHTARFSFGPTGQLYAQIKNGAPFDAFFGADERRPLMTIEDGLGIKDSYFVYAQGQLALYSLRLNVTENANEILTAGKFNKISLANPKTAPYGERAEAYLKSQGYYDNLKSKIVNGESISHAFQYVVTENAAIGFVALSQLVDPKSPAYKKGHYWIIPPADYEPINQGAIVTQRGSKNAATLAFMDYIKSPKAVAIIKRYGYNIPQ